MLNLIIYTSLFTLGLFIATGEGFVLRSAKNQLAWLLGGRYRQDGEDVYYQFPSKFITELWKPLTGCPVCMPSVWGTVIYSLMMPYSVDTIYELPIIICSSCAINFILFKNLIQGHV